ncbi:hypothetical protein [Desulfoluna spongiiphila]|uniref:hypothetical protein n=1 Tax=Desulfoluna spongiiphila TaxID=419481 RepID=UPI000B806906|nr:hypothetical protein [Desulfoluna spongiiphila]VVS93857.1 consensus disorder prediction [Desulfoluna spongiiphila]
MKHKRTMVNRSAQDRRCQDSKEWKGAERRTKEEKREQWQRAGKWRSKHKPISKIDLSHNALL